MKIINTAILTPDERLFVGGKRHHKIIAHMVKVFGKGNVPAGCTQGFITDCGAFADRKTAKTIVQNNGQPLTGPLRCELFSEELWTTEEQMLDNEIKEIEL